MKVRRVADAAAAAAAGAEMIAAAGAEAIAARGWFNFAFSGGTTPWAMLELLADGPLDWSRTSLFQVDERIAPSGSAKRNLTGIILALPLGCQASVRPMPVDADHPEVAMLGYGDTLPDPLDLIHLGLGSDGHTASLIPGDPVLEVRDRAVAMTAGEYQGTRRMTLTYPAIDRAREVLFLITGDGKREALDRLLSGDRSIPAGRVRNVNVTVITDIETGEGIAG